MWPKQTLQMCKMNITSNGRRPQMEDYLRYQKWNISATTGQIFPKFYTKAYVNKANVTNFSNEDDLQWKTTSNGRLTQISKVKQLLVRSSLIFFWPNQTLQMFQMKTTSNGWQHQISKVKYLSKTRSDLPQIGNVSSVDQTKLYKCSKWRRP